MENQLKTSSFQGLAATALKIIALIIMTIDHVGAFCPNVPAVAPMVTQLRIIGRIAAPIFLFCAAESLRYTRDKRLYLKRLYLASVCVGLLHALMAQLLDCSFSNIFQSFAWLAALVIVLEEIREGIKEKAYGKALGYFLGFGLLVTLSVLVSELMLRLDFQYAYLLRNIVGAVINSPVQVEYSVGFIVLGAIWYYVPGKKARCAMLFVLCILCALNVFRGIRGMQMFTGIQWGMLGAIPLILLYNGERGSGCKWLFYIYYPSHAWLLALINMLSK